MKKEKYLPYKFDEKFEYIAYLLIGKRRIKEFFSKIFKNRKPKYFYFDKYSEWEKYFGEKFSYDSYNLNNFMHYLNKKLRIYKRVEEACKSLVIPAYILEISILSTMFLSKEFDYIVRLLLCSLFLIGYAQLQIAIYNTKAYFIEDCINILKRAVNEE